jgi:small-conductance mechanosensitive channel
VTPAGARLALACALVLLLPARGSAQVLPEGEVPVAPVVLDGQVLYSVRGVSAYPAEERAAAIVGRIRDLAADPAFDPPELRTTPVDGGLRVEAPDGRLVMFLYASDAAVEGVGVEVLAKLVLVRIPPAIVAWRAARTPEALLDSAWHALGALAALVAGLLLLGWAARRVEARLEARYHARVPHLGIGSFEIVRAERIWKALRTLSRLLRWAVGLALAYVCLRYAFGRFPHTRQLADDLDGLVTGPLERIGQGLLDFLPDLVFLVILYLITRWFVRLTQAYFQSVEAGRITLQSFEPEWAMPTFRLVRIGIVAFALVVAYPYIPGSESAAFKGVSLFLGVLFSLGSSTAISNIVAGYMLTYRRAFRLGDRVRIGDVTGEVVAIRLQVTHLRTRTNESVTIPNSAVLAGEVVNYSLLAASEGLVLQVTLGIGYETPWRQVEAMLLEAARRTPGLLHARPAFVQQLALGDFAVTYELNAYCDQPRELVSLRTALHRSVLDVFNEYGVQIMTPAYEGDTEQPKVVPKEHWYAAPAAPPAAGKMQAGA